MDVRLPDGTIVTNVPEGITQSELLRRLGKSTSKETTPPPEKSTLGGMAAEAAKGAVRGIADTGIAVGQ
jgi:hypothetical protein